MAEIRITTPGILKSRKIGFQGLLDGDTISTVTATTSLAALTVTNVAVSGGPVTIGSITHDTGRSITFDVNVASGVDVDDDSEQKIRFDYTTVAGERLLYEKSVVIDDYIEVK